MYTVFYICCVVINISLTIINTRIINDVL